MGILKDALLKAGIKPTPKPSTPAPPSLQNQREKIAKKKITEDVVHQKQRNFCEHCEQVHPDVEFYRHRNPTTEAEWICIRCADQLQIADKFRETAQSDTSIKKLFRREYGATTPFHFFKNQNTEKSNGPVNGNR